MADTEQGSGKPRGQRGGGRRPVDSKTRARVRKLGREGLTRNAIAREVKLSPSTVSRICAEAKPPITFDRTAVAVAIEARTIDLKGRRAQFATDSLDLAEQFMRRMFQERTVSTTDGNGTIITYQQEPSARDWKDTMTAYGIAIDKHLVLVRHDSDDRDLPAVDQWLAHVLREAS